MRDAAARSRALLGVGVEPQHPRRRGAAAEASERASGAHACAAYGQRAAVSASVSRDAQKRTFSRVAAGSTRLASPQSIDMIAGALTTTARPRTLRVAQLAHLLRLAQRVEEALVEVGPAKVLHVDHGDHLDEPPRPPRLAVAREERSLLAEVDVVGDLARAVRSHQLAHLAVAAAHHQQRLAAPRDAALHVLAERPPSESASGCGDPAAASASVAALSAR